MSMVHFRSSNQLSLNIFGNPALDAILSIKYSLFDFIVHPYLADRIFGSRLASLIICPYILAIECSLTSSDLSLGL